MPGHDVLRAYKYMRNSFSLSVHFLLVHKCDVRYMVIKTTLAKMKLILLIVSTISMAVNVESNEHYTFPPKFHSHNSGPMSPDRTVYLPPESHTPMPYFPMKNVNLPYPYLPSTATKAPSYFSTPFPMIMSSTLLSIDNNDDDDEDAKLSSDVPRHNRTERSHSHKVETRELRPKQNNYQTIDRIDMKVPYGFTNHNQANTPTQNATPRSLIISQDTHRNDAIDQYKAASGFQGPQYIPAPNIPGVYLSSTTETAVPIIRLSNEMDLDGSFSYEALGADQTHYVQHSRMENMGSEKQEQVVEGSYSYVGDNGQTYTVNYIADSNGFRASGDHLPVAPPIPEIIQRAIQYNLAEEAKKPPHMKSWQNEETESESEKNQRYAISPPRNLFTGKTPESFSFAFSQGPQNIQNNLVPAASTQTPIKANVDFTPEQMKSKINNGISPQITFLASQGAHVPSVNPQQTMGRVFTTERSTMPQLINYEAGLKESEESNKALWRWQYGLNANINQTPDKNSISRSFGEGDEVMMNFNEMTPQQYTSMIQSQLQSQNESPQIDQIPQASDNMKSYQPQNNQVPQNHISPEPKSPPSTESYYISNQSSEWSQNKDEDAQSPNLNENYSENIHNSKYLNVNQIQRVQSNKSSNTLADSRSKLITRENFIPPSQAVTHSYNYEDIYYEPQKVRLSTMEPQISSISNDFQSYSQNSLHKAIPNNIPSHNTNQIKYEQTTLSSEIPTQIHGNNNFKFTDFIIEDTKNDFRPISKPIDANEHAKDFTTTEDNNEDILTENIFLKKLFSSKTEKAVPRESNHIRKDVKIADQPKLENKIERKHEKAPKLMEVKSNTFNDIQTIRNKPLDMADVMKFISMKNHFESAKTKPKPKFEHNTYNQKNEMRFTPMQQNRYDNEDVTVDHSSSDLRTNYYRPEELRGIIKNYKVLQRNNSAFNSQEPEQLRRDLTPPPVKISASKLPPLGRAGPSMKSYLPPIYV